MTEQTGRYRAILAAPQWTLGRLGAPLMRRWSGATYILAVIGAVFALAVRPSSWSAAVRSVLARQILFTGVEALSFALRIAAAVGVLLVVQAELWLGALGQSELIGSLLLNVIVRELAPLLANFVVIVRSGTAMATELASMRLEGEVEVLDAQGIDPMIYLVMPRVISTSVSVFCLAVTMVVACFVSGYVVGTLLGVINQDAVKFFGDMLGQVRAIDLLFFLPKTLLSGLFIGTICSVQGLSVRGAVTEVPQVAGRAAVTSLSVVFTVSAVLSLTIYGSVLFINVF